MCDNPAKSAQTPTLNNNDTTTCYARATQNGAKTPRRPDLRP